MRTPFYHQVWTDGKPTGLYELAGFNDNGRFVKAGFAPLRTKAQWEALDKAPPPPRPRRSPGAVMLEVLTRDVPAPPCTLELVVQEQRRRLGAEPLPDPEPVLRTNAAGKPLSTLERVVQYQRATGVRPPADVREMAVPHNPNHRQGCCWRCMRAEVSCVCPTVAPLVAHAEPPRRAPEPTVCRHCKMSLCRCVIETPDTMARVVERQRELRALTS